MMELFPEATHLIGRVKGTNKITGKPRLVWELHFRKQGGNTGEIRRSNEVNTMGQWTFLTNHGQVLIFLAKHPKITGRELSLSLGITERAVRRIIDDLEAASYVMKKRTGRRITYTVNPKLHFRHPEQQDREIGVLLRGLGWKPKPERSKT